MRYNKIRKMDIANGPGVRVSIFMQGCTFNCFNCFNPETHDFNGGKEFSDETIDKVLNLCSKEYIRGLSILGGDPLHPKNIDGTTRLAKKFKQKFPNKTAWLYTGYIWDDIKDLEAVKYLDVVVDGPFEKKLLDPQLHWKGSANQRVIDVQPSLKNNDIVLHKDN